MNSEKAQILKMCFGIVASAIAGAVVGLAFAKYGMGTDDDSLILAEDAAFGGIAGSIVHTVIALPQMWRQLGPTG